MAQAARAAAIDEPCHKVMLEETPPAEGETGRCDFRVGVFWMERGLPTLGVCSRNGCSWAIVRLQLPPDLASGCFISFIAFPAFLQGVIVVLSSDIYKGDFESTLVAFDVATGRHVGTWNAPQILPENMPRQGHHMCVHQGKIAWLLQTAPRKVDLWVMDFVTQTWTLLSAFPESRFFHPGENFSLRDAHTTGDMLYLAFRVALLVCWPWENDGERLHRAEVERVVPRSPLRRAVLVGYHIHLKTWHTIAEDLWDVSKHGDRADRTITVEWRPELYL